MEPAFYWQFRGHRFQVQDKLDAETLEGIMSSAVAIASVMSTDTEFEILNGHKPVAYINTYRGRIVCTPTPRYMAGGLATDDPDWLIAKSAFDVAICAPQTVDHADHADFAAKVDAAMVAAYEAATKQDPVSMKWRTPILVARTQP
jgi:hypothetical protein